MKISIILKEQYLQVHTITRKCGSLFTLVHRLMKINVLLSAYMQIFISAPIFYFACSMLQPRFKGKKSACAA